MASEAEVAAFVAAMPKCELHVHLEGAMTPAMKLTLAARNGIDLKFATTQEIEASYLGIHDTPAFLSAYYAGVELLQTASDFYEVARGFFETLAAEHVRYVELSFDPQAHTSRGVGFGIVIEGIRRAQVEAEALGVSSQLIMCFCREWQAEYAMATLLESLDHKSAIAGVGLDSDSRGNPPSKFKAVFDQARRLGYKLTSHCDYDIPGGLEHLREALDVIGVDRVDHGIDGAHDPRLLEELVRRQIPMTVCPISYKKTTYGSVVNGIGKEAEIRALYQAGANITISSDDPGYYAGHLTANLLALQKALGLGPGEMVRLQEAAFRAAWVSPGDRERYLGELTAFAADRTIESV